MPTKVEGITLEMGAQQGGVPAFKLVKKLNDLLRALIALDKQMSEDHRKTARWVVTKASYNSPLVITVAPRPLRGRTPNREVPRTFVAGIKLLEEGATEPPYFTRPVMLATRRLLKTKSETGGTVMLSGPDTDPIRTSKHLIKNINSVLRSKNYHEYTTIDGNLEGINIHHKYQIFVYDALTDHPTTCYFPKDLYEKARDSLGYRVAVTGLATFDREDRPISMDVDEIVRFKDSSELPRFLEGEEIDITGGMDSVEFVRRIRDAE